MLPTFQQQTGKSSKALRNSLPGGSQRSSVVYNSSTQKCKTEEDSQEWWCDINEFIESDFLISPGDIYPNRKVQLEDADI